MPIEPVPDKDDERPAGDSRSSSSRYAERMGRPSLYTPELIERICERLENGEPLAAICRDTGMPAVRTFLQWADEKPEVAAAYTRALEARAEWAVAEHERIRLTAVDKDSAAAARVQLSALEWQMSKMAPKRYGDRVDLNVDHTFDLANVVDRRRQRVLDANESLGITGPAGEGEP